MAAAARPLGAAAASGSFKRELGATLRARLADRSRQRRDQLDDRDRHHHARLALAARARRGRARLQPLSSTHRARHRRRVGVFPDRRVDGWRWQDRRSRRATHAGVPLVAVALSLLTWIYLWRTRADSAGHRRTSRSRARRRDLHARLQWSLLPNLMFFTGRCIFSALERPRPTLVAGLVAVVFNVLANYALIFGTPRHAGARNLRLRPCNHTFADADVSVAFRGLTRRAAIAPASTVRAPLAPCSARDGRSLAAWSAYRSHDSGRGRRLLRRYDVVGLIDSTALESHTAALQIVSLGFMVPLGSDRRRPFGSDMPTARATPSR